jgi:hypothetical protein
VTGIFVTLVDVVGVLVPGLVLLLGIALLPPVAHELKASCLLSWLQYPLEHCCWLLAIAGLTAGYIVGFMIRLFSTKLLQFLCWRSLQEGAKKAVNYVEPLLEAALGDKQLSSAIRATLPTERPGPLGKYHHSRYAPFFDLARHLVRASGSSLWAQAERREVDVRLMTGLLVPLTLLALDGVLYVAQGWVAFGLCLTPMSVIAIILIAYRFPRYRAREAFDVYMA